MLTNYVIVALRNLLRHKFYTLINLLGLSIGLTCCILALAIIHHETSYNRFHPQSDRIHRILRERISNNQKQVRWLTSGALARTIENEIPEIEAASKNRIYKVGVRYEGQTQDILQGHVDNNFFHIFNFTFSQGSAQELKRPYHAAITERAAKRLFGVDDPIGKVISLQERYYGGDYTISAVLQTPPSSSSLNFDLLHQTDGRTEEAKTDWEGWQGRVQQAGIETFVLLREGVVAKTIESKISAVIDRHMGTDVRAVLTYRLQPLLRMHLYNDKDYNLDEIRGSVRIAGDIQTLYIFAAVALIILIIAAINFVNLATARSTLRIREVGIRKVVGAHRRQLFLQFLGESIFLTLLSFCLALVIAASCLSYVNILTDNRFPLTLYALTKPLPLFLVFSILVGTVAGLYPAWYLSNFHPTAIFKGISHTSRSRFRQFLVITQFTVATVLVVVTRVVDQQQTYIRNKDLGFQQEHIVILPIFELDRESKTNRDPWLVARYNTVKQAFLQHPSILAAGAFRFRPGRGGGFIRIVKPEGHETTEWRMPVQEAGEDFFNVLNIPLLAGRSFSPDIERDRTHSYILNRTAVNALGWDVENAVGRRFGRARSEEDANGTVIGVVDDFHYASLREAIQPAAIGYRQWFYEDLALRIRPGNWDDSRQFLETVWQKFMSPDIPFTFRFLDEDIASIYHGEEQTGRLVTLFSGLAILLASLGLFGLTAFTAERRVQEIGIRKSLGASVSNIVLLLSVDFLKLVCISIFIAWPLAYYVAYQWLQSFVYRIDLNIWPFIGSGCITLFISVITIAYQAIATANTNPVHTIRSE